MYGIMILKLFLEHKEETLTFSHEGIIVIYHADAVLSIQNVSQSVICWPSSSDLDL